MGETLGSLCDKLTIVKLKQWHSEDPGRLESLALQEKQMAAEIDQLLGDAVAGNIKADRLTFASNKVFKKEGNVVGQVVGGIGAIFAQLADVNCKLWHEQEKVYEFEKVAAEERVTVVRKLGVLNLERNACIDEIDKQFRSMIEKLQKTN
ncbi:MAG: hypothetical protein M3O30_14485 [Planctomycetota bacterium]|nr:hypothetical protein [Planctomycetota bacterium]